MQNNSNKIINIARKGFADSLALALYKTDDLLACLCSRGKEHSLPNVLAELYVRYCFAPSPDLRLKLSDLLPDGVGETLLSVANRFPYSEPPFATDLDYGNTRKIKEAIAARWNHFANADGAFPVCSENDAFLLPFYLHEHQENTPLVIDWNGNEIAEWNDAIEKLHIPYQVKVSISGNVKLEGHSLQLPVYLASLVKSNNFLPFDPYRFIATGAIENSLLKPVLFATKYDVLHHKYANALFVCPKPSEDCVIADTDTEIIPVGFSLHDTRNFCAEFIVKHHLLKNEPASKSFSGRQYELSKIHSLLNPYSNQNKKIPLLLGASGIGKTALANQYAKIMTGCEYYGYALLNGASNSLPDLFNTFYSNPTNQERFGFIIPDALKTSQEKFESFLHQIKRCGKRVLFILDNLAPELQLNEDIKDFFPDYAESCIDIIATANVCQFCVNDDDIVCTLRIDGLSVTDGIGLLQNKRTIESAEEREAAKEIVDFLGGNAWALAVVGETLKQAPEKFDDDYREKLKELRQLPLETLTPDSGMVRISHGKEIDPVKLLQPVLDRLDPETLEIAQVAACCAPEYIYPKWLKDFYELQHNVKFDTDRQWRKKNIIASLKQSNILQEYGELFHMHRLTRLLLQKNEVGTIICDLLKEKIDENSSYAELESVAHLICEIDIAVFCKQLPWIADNPGGKSLSSILFAFGLSDNLYKIINRAYDLYRDGTFVNHDSFFVNLFLYEIQIWIDKGFFERAIACCEHIKPICDEIGASHSTIGTLYSYWGNAYRNLGFENRLLADDYFKNELAEYEKTGVPSLIIRGLLDLALFYSSNLNGGATVLCERALEIEKHTAEIKTETRIHLYRTYATVLIDDGKYEHAYECSWKALEYAKQIYAVGNPKLMYSYQTFSYICFRVSKLDEGLEYGQKALDLAIQYTGKDSLHTATCYNILARNPKHEIRHSMLLKTHEILRNYFPEDHPRIIKLYLDLANCLKKHEDMRLKGNYLEKIAPFKRELTPAQKISYYRSLADVQDCEGNFQEAVNILQSNIINDSIFVSGVSAHLIAVVYSDIASFYRRMKNWTQSIEHYRKAMEYFKLTDISVTHFDLTQLRNNMCYLYLQMGDCGSAISLRRNFINNLLTQFNPNEDIDSAMVSEAQALLKIYSDHSELSLEDFGDIVEHMDKSNTQQSQKTAIFYNNFAKLLRSRGKASDAIKYHDLAIGIFRKNNWDSTLDGMTLKTNYARTLIELGRYDEAMELEKDALEFRLATLPDHHEYLAINYYDIGQILFKQGIFDEAIAYLTNALNVVSRQEYNGQQITSEVIQELLDKIRS